MKYYKDENSKIYEFDESQTLSIPVNLIQITYEEATLIKNTIPTITNENLLYMINELENRVSMLEEKL